MPLSIQMAGTALKLGASQVVLVVKNPPAIAGDIRDAGSIPGLGRFPGEGHGNLLQYSCLENPMDRGAWWATVHGVAKSQTRLKQLSKHACAHPHSTCLHLSLLCPEILSGVFSSPSNPNAFKISPVLQDTSHYPFRFASIPAHAPCSSR